MPGIPGLTLAAPSTSSSSSPFSVPFSIGGDAGVNSPNVLYLAAIGLLAIYLLKKA